MSITITAQTIGLTTEIKSYIEKRLGKFAKVTTGEPLVVVEVGKTTAHHQHGDIFEAKVTVTTPLGKVLHAVSQKSDLYEAIDDIRAEMMRELVSTKDKKTTLVRRGAQQIKRLLRGNHS